MFDCALFCCNWIGPLQVSEDVLVQLEADSFDDTSSPLLRRARIKSVYGMELSAEEQAELSASPQHKAAERWIATHTGGYGQIAPPAPKANAASTR